MIWGLGEGGASGAGWQLEQQMLSFAGAGVERLADFTLSADCGNKICDRNYS